MPVGGALAGEACARSADSNRALGFQFVLNCLGFPANLTGARSERPSDAGQAAQMSARFPLKIPIELWDSN